MIVIIRVTCLSNSVTVMYCTGTGTASDSDSEWPIHGAYLQFSPPRGDSAVSQCLVMSVKLQCSLK